MKRFLILILGLVLGVQAFGQSGIYSEIKYMDKFDDPVKVETKKTIVEKTDSTFIVETKGKSPQVYRIYFQSHAETWGSKDEIVNLLENVYGFEEVWYVMKEDDFDEWKMLGTVPAKNYLLKIIHRVVVTQYTHDFKSEYLWVEDDTNTKLGKDINRIIYKK